MIEFSFRKSMLVAVWRMSQREVNLEVKTKVKRNEVRWRLEGGSRK
jgi:hypothetical protein